MIVSADTRLDPYEIVSAVGAGGMGEVSSEQQNLPVKLDARVEGSRTRRLEPSVSLPEGTVADGEEARLLKHSGPHLP